MQRFAFSQRVFFEKESSKRKSSLRVFQKRIEKNGGGNAKVCFLWKNSFLKDFFLLLFLSFPLHVSRDESYLIRSCNKVFLFLFQFKPLTIRRA